MFIEIDTKSGFCFGVVYAIQKAENELENDETLYCLGDIVHNGEEVARLGKKGLKTIDYDEFKKLKNAKVLIRAHGEPPETYKIALENNINLVDASCPVVLKLQNRIKNGYNEIAKVNGQVVIYGQKGHAEVNGLVGQTEGEAIVVSEMADLEKIDFKRPVFVFSQTTKSIPAYQELIDEIRKRMIDAQNSLNVDLRFHDTICRQVSGRNNELREFSKKHNIIIFTSGKKSSNGKVLYNVCLENNPNTYFVSSKDELKKEWFYNCNSVGICGATSTPRWLMEEIKAEIFRLCQ